MLGVWTSPHSVVPLALDPIQESNLNPFALVCSFNVKLERRGPSNTGRKFIVSSNQGQPVVCNKFLQAAQRDFSSQESGRAGQVRDFTMPGKQLPEAQDTC